ncbi:30S ribosomal protein S18 [Candidatus Roizmanbacteria bacterium]|nr:30S ribosomal protein S18 [Candidatus Roizmanbacteria bacterium]
MAAKPVRRPRRKISVPKNCHYCTQDLEPSFWETNLLQRFLTERNKIIPRSRNGLCAKHQNSLALNIKYARFLALMPFISK